MALILCIASMAAVLYVIVLYPFAFGILGERISEADST